MQIEFLCHCGAKMRTSAEHIGKRGRCAKCSAIIEIKPITNPGQGTEPSAATSSAAANNRIAATKVVADPELSSSSALTSGSLDLGDFNFEGNQPAVVTSWSPTPSYQAPGKQQGSNASWIWLAVGIGALCIFAFVGLIAVVYSISANRGATVANRSDAAPNVIPAGSLVKPAASGPPITEAEAEAVTQRFVEAIKSRNFVLCKQLFNTDRMFEAIADQAKLVGMERRSFLAGAGGRGQIWDQVNEVTRAGGEYIPLKPVRRDDQVRYVVRLNSDQSGLNYHEYMFGRNERQEVVIDDVYIMAAGCTLSESIGRIAIALLASRDSSLIGRLSGANRSVIQNSNSMVKIQSLAKSAPHLALEEFSKLSADLQKDKSVMVMKLQVCAAVSPEKYIATFEEFKQLFPNDVSLDLLSLDYHISRNDMASAIAATERLNAYIGGDPLLDEVIAGLRAQ